MNGCKRLLVYLLLLAMSMFSANFIINWQFSSAISVRHQVASRPSGDPCHDQTRSVARLVAVTCRRYRRLGRHSHEIRDDVDVRALFASQFVIVDDKRQIVYCGVPKVASTSFKKLLVQTLIGADPRQPPPCPVHNDSCLESLGLKILGRLPPEVDVRKRLDAYFKFLVVRHPLDRLLSTYEDKFSGSRRNFLSCRQYRKRVELYFDRLRYDENGYPLLTPEQFLEIVAVDRYFRNRHWSSYMITCQPCRIGYDHVIRLENLGQDIGPVLERLGYDTNGTLSGTDIPHDNASKLGDNLNQMYSRLRNLRPDIVKRLLTIYGSDMEMFGYSWINGTPGMDVTTSSCPSY